MPTYREAVQRARKRWSPIERKIYVIEIYERLKGNTPGFGRVDYYTATKYEKNVYHKGSRVVEVVTKP